MKQILHIDSSPRGQRSHSRQLGNGQQMEAMNFQDPYLKAAFGLIGITDISFIHDEKSALGDSNLPASLEAARQAAYQADELAIAA